MRLIRLSLLPFLLSPLVQSIETTQSILADGSILLWSGRQMISGKAYCVRLIAKPAEPQTITQNPTPTPPTQNLTENQALAQPFKSPSSALVSLFIEAEIDTGSSNTSTIGRSDSSGSMGGWPIVGSSSFNQLPSPALGQSYASVLSQSQSSTNHPSTPSLSSLSASTNVSTSMNANAGSNLNTPVITRVRGVPGSMQGSCMSPGISLSASPLCQPLPLPLSPPSTRVELPSSLLSSFVSLSLTQNKDKDRGSASCTFIGSPSPAHLFAPNPDARALQHSRSNTPSHSHRHSHTHSGFSSVGMPCYDPTISPLPPPRALPPSSPPSTQTLSAPVSIGSSSSSLIGSPMTHAHASSVAEKRPSISLAELRVCDLGSVRVDGDKLCALVKIDGEGKLSVSS